MYYIGGEFICKEKPFECFFAARSLFILHIPAPFSAWTKGLLSQYDTKMLPLVHNLFMIVKALSGMV